MKNMDEKNEVGLSIIIPVYNAVSTLKKCVDSILGQTYTDIEVICVDDGSLDDSLALCKDYSKKDSRVKVITKMNGGVASARNAGLDVAMGKYVTFVDQDDWIELNMYDQMIEKAIEHNADMVVCNYFKDTMDNSTKMNNKSDIEEFIESREDLIKYAFFREEYRGYAAFVWNKIFKREVLEANKIRFEDGLQRGDDVLFYSMVSTEVKRTIYINEHFYHYFQRKDSVTHTLTADNISKLSQILVGYDMAIDFLQLRDMDNSMLDYMKCFYVYHASILYELALKENLKEEQEKFQKAMRRFIEEYKIQNSFSEERIQRIKELLLING